MYSKANAVILPTGCDNERIQLTIGEENSRRISNKQAPFLTYDEWYNAPKTEAPAASRFTNIDHTNDVNTKLSKQVASYLVDGKYYILRDGGTTYIYNNADAIQPSDKRVLRLMKQPIDGQPFSNSSGNVVYMSPINPLVNLTDKEHQSIIDEEPSFDDLLNVYVLASNDDGVEMNFRPAVKVW